jgi:hypothetical protein
MKKLNKNQFVAIIFFALTILLVSSLVKTMHFSASALASKNHALLHDLSAN